MIVTFPQLMSLLLIITRLIGLILMAPIFNDKRFFTVGKIAFIIWVGILFLFVVPLSPNPPATAPAFVLAMVCELLLGAIIGFVTDLLITGIEFAGALMDTQAGLSVANLLDPSTGRQVTLFSTMLKWTTILIFLSIDGHHIVLTAVVESFKVLPIGAPINFARGGMYLVGLGTQIFYLGVQLAAPIILVVFLVDFGFGMLNKVAEQVNVFQLGFQIKPTVSLIIFLAIIPNLTSNIFRILEGISEHIVKVFHSLQF